LLVALELLERKTHVLHAQGHAAKNCPVSAGSGDSHARRYGEKGEYGPGSIGETKWG